MVDLRRVAAPLALALLVAAPGCGDGGGAGGGGQPPAAGLKAFQPVGLFFMTRYSSGNLEKAAWYFSPEGKAYENLATGFSPEDLAAHKGRIGTCAVAGDTLTMTWADGTKEVSKVEPDAQAPNFAWDMGLFSPATPFKDAASMVALWDGGASGGFNGSRVSVGTTLELKADGTFVRESASSMDIKDPGSRVTGGATGPAVQGKWTLDGYSLVFQEPDGKTRRQIAFMIDDETTPVVGDWMFLGGMLFKRK